MCQLNSLEPSGLPCRRVLVLSNGELRIVHHVSRQFNPGSGRAIIGRSRLQEYQQLLGGGVCQNLSGLPGADSHSGSVMAEQTLHCCEH